MDLVLIRHPPVKVPEGTCYGQKDVPLLSGWELGLDALKTDLFSKADSVYSSPSLRCLQPATRWGLQPVHVDPALMELHFGDWEGLTWDEIPHPALTEWMEAFWEARPPGGESMPDLQKRVSRWLEQIRRLPQRRVIVFTHAGVIRTLKGLLENIPAKELFQIKVPHLHPFRFEI